MAGPPRVIPPPTSRAPRRVVYGPPAPTDLRPLLGGRTMVATSPRPPSMISRATTQAGVVPLLTGADAVWNQRVPASRTTAYGPPAPPARFLQRQPVGVLAPGAVYDPRTGVTTPPTPQTSRRTTPPAPRGGAPAVAAAAPPRVQSSPAYQAGRQSVLRGTAGPYGYNAADTEMRSRVPAPAPYSNAYGANGNGATANMYENSRRDAYVAALQGAAAPPPLLPAPRFSPAIQAGIDAVQQAIALNSPAPPSQAYTATGGTLVSLDSPAMAAQRALSNILAGGGSQLTPENLELLRRIAMGQ